MTKHTQVGPPAMVGNYRVRVVEDSENPHFLSKATWENPLDRVGPVTISMSGPPSLRTIIVAKHEVLVEHEGKTARIPVEALEAVLKVAGWKAWYPR